MEIRQATYCTFDVKLGRVRATIFAVEKLLSITYTECVFVAFGIQRALRLRHIVVCALFTSTILFHIIS
jgi:hypothetical protein